MRTETITRDIHTFNELDDTAREKAREWFREHYRYEGWWDCAFDDIRLAASMIGIDIDRDGISFSGFSSQGDGACFVGSYAYKPGSLAAIRSEWPNDTVLHRIASDLMQAQRSWFYGLSARVERCGHYSHEYSVSVEVEADEDMTGDRDTSEAEDDITEILRDFMRWTYARLEAEYEWLMSEESVDENIKMNEYEFYADGSVV